VATGQPLGPATEVPGSWREFVATRSRQPPPVLLGDGGTAAYVRWEPGEGDPDSPLDRAVTATRRAVWPLHGLDPVATW
jgi:acetoin utilization protein AcuC